MKKSRIRVFVANVIAIMASITVMSDKHVYGKHLCLLSIVLNLEH